MQNNHPNKPPIDPALQERIEKEARSYYDNYNIPSGSPYLEEYINIATPYARKLDIAMKALEDIAMSKVLPQTIASQALTRIKQLNNG